MFIFVLLTIAISICLISNANVLVKGQQNKSELQNTQPNSTTNNFFPSVTSLNQFQTPDTRNQTHNPDLLVLAVAFAGAAGGVTL